MICTQQFETPAPFGLTKREPETLIWGEKEILVKWVEVIAEWVGGSPFRSMRSPQLERKFSALLPFETVVQLYTNGRVKAEYLSDDEQAKYHYSTILCDRFNRLDPRPKMTWVRRGETITDLEMKLVSNNIRLGEVFSGDVILTGILEWKK